MKRQQIIDLAKEFAQDRDDKERTEWSSQVDKVAEIADLRNTLDPRLSIRAADVLLRAAHMEQIVQNLGLHERRRV